MQFLLLIRCKLHSRLCYQWTALNYKQHTKLVKNKNDIWWLRNLGFIVFNVRHCNQDMAHSFHNHNHSFLQNSGESSRFDRLKNIKARQAGGSCRRVWLYRVFVVVPPCFTVPFLLMNLLLVFGVGILNQAWEQNQVC